MSGASDAGRGPGGGPDWGPGRLAGHDIAIKVFRVERSRFLGAVAGVAFAVFLMTFQGSLFTGFLRAAGRVPAASGAQIWVMARGLDCFDFPSPIADRYEARLHGVPGVVWTRRMVVGLASWIGESGDANVVQLVGSEHHERSSIPRPEIDNGSSALPEEAIVDSSSLSALGVAGLPVAVEINGQRATVRRTTDGFGSFLGAPVVFTSYEESREMLRLDPGKSSFLLVGTDPGYPSAAVAEEIGRKLPELSVLTTPEFISRSGAFWMVKTGAGGAISLAGVLGLLIGLVVVTQILHGMMLERVHEVATFKALGASRLLLKVAIVAQALFIGGCGWLLGTVAVLAAIGAAGNLVSWIWMPPWLPAATVAVTLAMCAAASVFAVRYALDTEPERVFRG